MTLGRIWNIPVGLDWSWFVVFGLVTWSLALGYLPEQFPTLSPLASWLLGAITALLLFGSVLLHELGHVFAARRNNVPVHSVSLHLFGGIAAMGAEPRTPGAEFRIAIAGPLVSLALAALFGGLALLDLPLLAVPGAWLAQLNLVLALFNMLPGFPLDGGRVLRAVVWKWSGNEARATRVAALSGQVTALGLIAFGAYLALGGNVLGGVWLFMIGWFLQGAALAALTRSNTAQPDVPQLAGISVDRATERFFPQVPGELSLQRLVDDYVLTDQRGVVVTGSGGGLVTLRAVQAVARDRWHAVNAAEVMLPWECLPHVRPDADIVQAIELLERHDLQQLPVVLDGHVVGLASREQMLRLLHDAREPRDEQAQASAITSDRADSEREHTGR